VRVLLSSTKSCEVRCEVVSVSICRYYYDGDDFRVRLQRYQAIEIGWQKTEAKGSAPGQKTSMSPSSSLSATLASVPVVAA
jgi:hypothetical protein